MFIDPFGFGNTGMAEKMSKFAPLPENLKGLRVGITGGNSGIGFATAKCLAQKGAKVYLLCRDISRAEEAKLKMGGDVDVVQVDTSSYNSIRNIKIPDLDVLVHNAGAMYDKKEVVQWPNGPIDQTFALHVAGPYLLSKQVKAKNTIWVSSGGMYTEKLNVQETLVPPEKEFDGMKCYARCKRAQVVLAKLLGHQSMHPGWVDTPGVEKAMPKFYKKTKTVLRTLEEGADTIVFLAVMRPSEKGFWFDREIV